MATYILEINLDGAAFAGHETHEVGRILGNEARRLQRWNVATDGFTVFKMTLVDFNGIKCGRTRVEGLDA